MKNVKTIVLLFLAVVIIGVIYVVTKEDTNYIVPATEIEDVDVALDSVESGSYIAYTDDAAKAAATEGSAVLFFYASWCPSCRLLDSNIQSKLKNLPSEITILKVNYDTQDDLKKKYKIRRQHTLVQVDASLNQIKSWFGSRNIADIVAQVQ